MASSYTANTGIEKPGTGEQAGTWGTTTNNNFDIIDRAINGVVSLSLSGTTTTLTTTDGTLSDGGHKVLVLGGSPSGTNTITISPNDQDKVYLVKNGTDQTATFTQGSGGNINVIAGETAWIFADGAGSGAAVQKAGYLSDVVKDTTPQLGGSLDVNGNSITTSVSNGSVSIVPNGTGDLVVEADNVRIGDNNTNASITTYGTGDLTLSTNGGTNSGIIVIADGANGDISITPNGTGKLVVSSDITVNASNIVFEGSSADDHETTIAVTDPTADRTITFPDASGTVALSADVSSAVPSGTVLVTARSSAPTGYLLCDGAAVSRSTYSDLFSAISTTYGTGDGSSTFNVPDLRGRVVAGKDDMGGSSANRLTDQTGGLNGDTLGDTGGSETHTLTTAQLAAHTHGAGSYNVETASVSNASASVRIKAQGQDLAGSSESVAGTSGSTGSGSAHNNVQPTIILNYMIKT